MNVAVLISGGVDSSVALKLLRQSGTHNLTAFYLKIWLEDELAALGHCPWEEDLGYVRAVCEAAGVPLRVVPLQAEYHSQVVDFAIRELNAGRTPSPDLQCNAWIKFGAFQDRIAAEGFDTIATGHYARVERRGDAHVLLRAPDPVKDQTYFLARLRQDQLARACFPIGHLQKREVRVLAQAFDLPNRDRPDSQGICFLGKIKFPDFVRAHLGTRPGEFIEHGTERVLGAHQGYWFFTIGQRQGIGLGGGPWYVVRKDIATNRVFIARPPEQAAAATRSFAVEDLHWIGGAAPTATRLLVRVRHGPRLAAATLIPKDDGGGQVTLDEPDPGIAPGQSAVFYEGEVCLGVGTIAATGVRPAA